MYRLHVVKLDPKATLPTVVTPGEDLGYDLYALEPAYVFQGRVVKIRTGIAVSAYRDTLIQEWNAYSPFDYMRDSVGYPQRKLGLLFRDRSSMADRGFLTLGGVIDAGYTGELKIMMTNVASGGHIQAGDKIAQMVPIEPMTGSIIEVATLDESARGGKGFGSSGR
jgi:dUTP pyrophosphatase